MLLGSLGESVVIVRINNCKSGVTASPMDRSTRLDI